MSSELHLLLNVAVAVVIALVGGLLAHRLRQSVIVGYLLAGVVIGPFTPGFVGDREEIAALAEVGVIFLMFALGIEFSFRELARVKGIVVMGTLVQIGLTIGAGVSLAVVLGWPQAQGLFFGCIVAISSSTMVVLKTLIDRGEVASPHGRTLLGILIIQDLATVVMIALLPKLALGSQDFSGVLTSLVTVLGFVGATIVLGNSVVPRFMHRVERLHSPELFLLTAVALALGTATVSAMLGLSPALGAFMAGLMLTETEFDHRVVAEIVPMRNLFATLFFVSVGMLIDPMFVFSRPGEVLGMAAFIMLAKVLASFLAIAPYRPGPSIVIFSSLGLLQVGEAAFILSRVGVQIGAISESLQTLILTSSVLSIAATPPAFALAAKLTATLGRLPRVQQLLSGQGLQPPGVMMQRDHAVVIGYGRVGRRVTEGLRRAGLDIIIVDDSQAGRELVPPDVPMIHGNAVQASILRAASVESARLLVVALPDSGTTRAVVRELRALNPSAPILARAARPEDEAILPELGATAVVAPEAAGAQLLLERCAHELNLDMVDLP